MSTELQRAAKKYAEMGFAIFPLAYHDKKPLTKNGLKDATTDPFQIENWWTKWPEANIGLVTGSRNGIVVIDLDIDPEKDVNGYVSLKSWQKEYGVFPHTLFSRTGRGGYHMFYKTTESFKNRVGMLPGIDIRADGGYIVAPPSIHPNGTAYEWQCDFDTTPVASIDDTIRKFLETGGKKPEEVNKLVIPDMVYEGNRNDTMFKIACSLQSKGLSNEAIHAACINENEQRFKPPLSEHEVHTIVESCTGRFRKGSPILFDATGEAIQRKKEPDFQRSERGSLLQTIMNAQEAIEYDEQLYGKIRYNDVSYKPFVVGSLPWDPNPDNFRDWTDFDDSGLKAYIEAKYRLRSGQKCMEALNNVLSRNHFNPIEEKLNAIYFQKWDKQGGHIRKLLPKYMGVEDDEYAYEVMKVFMLGAISRAYHPGCKFDYMMVLVGPQGIGKSAFLRGLCMESSWFNDNFNNIEGDKAFEKLRGMWMVELAELLATKKIKDQEAIKAFITSTVDTYRAAYGRRTEQRPRTCVFAGTTNTMQFLADPTGSRRFLPLETNIEKRKKNPVSDSKEFREDVEQAWGEAMDLFMKASMEPLLVMPDNVLSTVETMQERHAEEDPRIGIIQDWLDRNRSGMVCAVQIYLEALEHDRNDWTRKDINDIHLFMQHKIKGWKRLEKKKRCGRFGIQICYVPEEKDPDPAEDERMALPF